MKMVQALPKLDGRLGSHVRVFYLLLAALTVVIVAGGVVFNGLDYFRNMPADTRFGLRTYSSLTPGGSPFLAWTSSAAAASGLRVGDVIVAIQGEPIPAGTSEFGIGRRLDAIAGASAAITTRATDGSAATHIVPRAPHPWRERDFVSGLPLWLSVSTIFFGIEAIPLFLFAASLLLFSRRPRDPEAMLFAIGFLLLVNFPVADFWLLAVLGLPVGVAGALLFAGQSIVIVAAAGFPDGRFDSQWSRAVLLAAVPLSAITLFVDTLASNAGVRGVISAGSQLALSLIAIVGLSERYRRLDSSAARQQIKWAVLGFCVSAIATAAYMALLRANVRVDGAPGPFLAYQLLQLAAFTALPIGLVVSLLRYRLYDAEATISRSAAYAVLTASLVIVFAATEKLIELLGANVLGGSVGAVAGGIAAGVAAVMIAPMHHRIDHWARHRFQRGLVRLREGLPVLVGDLREVASLDQLGRAILSRVAEGVHARQLALLVDGRMIASRDVSPETVERWRAEQPAEDARIAQTERADPLFPLRIPVLIEEETRVGHLLVGPRPDGSFYGRDALEALDEIADPVARAIMICRQREAAEASNADLVRGLAAKIEQIEETLRRHQLV